MNKLINSGFIKDDILTENWEQPLGAVGSEDPDWRPEAELIKDKLDAQNKNGFETFCCTIWAFLNALTLIFIRKYKLFPIFSKRFLSILANTYKQQGNSPHTIAEAARKSGVLYDALLPFDVLVDTYEKFFSPRPLTSDLLQDASKFENTY